MKCGICGNPAGPCQNNKETLVWRFTMNLRSNFQLYTNLPCFMKFQIDVAMHNHMPVKTADNETYSFDLRKLDNKTRIHGIHYNKFLEDFDMQRHDVITLEWPPEKRFLLIYPQDANGIPKERVVQAQEYAFENSASAVVISRGVNPKPSEVDNINHAVLTRGLGKGAVFIHKLTHTDLGNTGLRIPKHLVSVIDAPRRGSAFLPFGQVPFSTRAQYVPTADGRIRFTDGWQEFASDSNLDIGMMVLILFDVINDNLHISFDVVGN